MFLVPIEALLSDFYYVYFSCNCENNALLSNKIFKTPMTLYQIDGTYDIFFNHVIPENKNMLTLKRSLVTSLLEGRWSCILKQKFKNSILKLKIYLFYGFSLILYLTNSEFITFFKDALCIQKPKYSSKVLENMYIMSII